jgi:hypothetical protein
MLTKALIAALAAIALAVVAPTAGAKTVKPRPAVTLSAAASAPKSGCLTITRVILANQEGVDPDPDNDSDEDGDRDQDSGADSDPGTDTDADSGPNTGESDPGPWEPPTSDPDENECEQ